MTGLKKICLHWTAGTYKRNDDDFVHYHYTVGEDGHVEPGKFPIEANTPGPHGLTEGHYAAHCGGGNSYCIGVGLRAMFGYVGPKDIGPYPITRVQFEAGCALLAKLCIENHIEVTPETVFSHYEFGLLHPSTSSAGKIDISFLPFKPELKPAEVGDYIRNKVQWYLAKLEAGL